MKQYDLIVIGGGSAGLAAAIAAHDEGIKSILLLEKEPYFGGILLQCIHNGFGLHEFKEILTGPEYAERFKEEFLKRNIDYRLNSYVMSLTKDKIVTYSNGEEGVVVTQARAIIQATGCGERNRGAISIPGSRPYGILTAGTAQRYLNIDGYLVGKRVFILGSGDIGLIMARRMTLEGATVLGVAEIMPYSNGLTRNIVQCLNDFNIPLYLSHTVSKIIGKNRLEKIVLSQVNEKFEWIENSEKEFEVDTLLLSVGLSPLNGLFENLSLVPDPQTKGAIVNEIMETELEGFFSCGNVLHVHDLVDFVTKEGRKAGVGAAKYLNHMLDRSDALITIKNGAGIGYVVPQKMNVKNLKSFVEINFRVTKPLENSWILAVFNGEVIKKVFKPHLIPSEMEIFAIDIRKFLVDHGELMIKIEEASL